MYQSTLLINTGDNPDRPDWNISRRWLRNLYRVHQRLCMAFPSAAQKNDAHFLKPYKPEGFPEDHYLADQKGQAVDRGMLNWVMNFDVHNPRTSDAGFLFRVDPLAGARAAILVQSAFKPDWDYAFHNAGYLLACPTQVKDWDPQFQAGDVLRFRLAANPTRRLREASVEADGSPVKQESVGKRVPVPTERLDEWLTLRAEHAGFRVQGLTGIQAGYVYVSKKADDKGTRLRSVRYDGILEVGDPVAFRDTLMRGIGPAKAFGCGLLSVAPVKGTA